MPTLPKAPNVSCLSSERSSCFASNIPCRGECTCCITTGLVNGCRQQAGDYFPNPPSGAPQSSEWEFLYIDDNYLGIFHHQNWICIVSCSTYLAITHLRCQLQSSQETVVLMEFCQQPQTVLKGLAEKRKHRRVIRPSTKGHRSQGLLPKCC